MSRSLTTIAAVAILLVLAGGIGAIFQKYSADIREKNETIRQLEEAARLTESLRKSNAILTQENSDLQEELRNADGRDVPLSPDVRSVVERMRDGK